MNLPVSEFAAAKVNLCLHVTGQRDDGYHLLDSLVAFAQIGDRLEAAAAESFSLTIEGPFSDRLPAGADNLVLRAARTLAPDFPTAFMLYKNLPPASGIGGGSADAAAAIRAVQQLRAQVGSEGCASDGDASTPAQARDFAALGADVPVCLASRPTRMRGIGEWLDPAENFPQGWILLVNPGVEVPTPAVFRALPGKENPPLPDHLPLWPTIGDLAAWLTQQRNDLEAPATQIAPVIGEVLAQMRILPGALIARMSGSGATCFALFESSAEANAAQQSLAQRYPDWWMAHGALIR